MDQERIDEWWWSNEERWDAMYKAFKDFRFKNKRLPSEHSDCLIERKLGKWCLIQRTLEKKGKLPNKRTDKLDATDR